MATHSKLIGRYVQDYFVDRGYFIGKIINNTNSKYDVLFIDGDIISYPTEYIKKILINIDDTSIVKRGKYYYKFIDKKYYRISETEYNEHCNLAFKLCSLKY